MSAFRLIASALLSISFMATATYETAEAQSRKKSAPRGRNSLEQSKSFKVGKDHTKVDFDDAAIEGQAKNPFGTLLNSRDQDFNRGFIKLRYNWHDYMKIGAMGMSQ